MTSSIKKVMSRMALICLTHASLLAQTEYLVTVNPATGVHTRVDSIPGVKIIQIGPSTSTIDKQNNRYFFMGKDAAQVWRLYTINCASSSIINSPVFLPSGSPFTNVGGFEFDNLTGQLFGLAWNASQSAESFISVNPVNGSITPVAVLPGVMGITIGESAYDQAGRRYFFKGSGSGGSQLFTIDANNGLILSQPTLTTNASEASLIRYNNVTNKLYGMASLAASPANLVELNPATLSTTVIGSVPNLAGVSFMPNYATMDELNGRYIFSMTNSSNVTQLTSISVSTGSIISSPSFPVGLAPAENVIELRFNNATGILYGLHWGMTPSVPTGIAPGQAVNSSFRVYPNPFLHSAILELDQRYKQVKVTISNAAGQFIRVETFFNQAAIEIKKENLTAGLYTVTLLTEAGVQVKKIIVE